MTVVSVLVALLLLGILITVHEFGHYIFARMTGIEVMEFAIGFGPKIVGWTGKSGTKFALRCIPLGGYCAFYGEDDVEGKATNDPRAFGKQPVWKRMLSVLMGPGMNFLLPLVVLVLSCLLGWVVAKIHSKLKRKNLLTTLIALAFFALYYMVCFRANELIEQLMLHLNEVGAAIRGSAYPLYLMGRMGAGDYLAVVLVLAVMAGLCALCLLYTSDAADE